MINCGLLGLSSLICASTGRPRSSAPVSNLPNGTPTPHSIELIRAGRWPFLLDAKVDYSAYTVKTVESILGERSKSRPSTRIKVCGQKAELVARLEQDDGPN